MSLPPSYGEVHGPPIGEISRRTFMRRLVGVGVGILSIEFLAGTTAFLWPNIRAGLGGELTIGSAADIANNEPDWVTGLPYAFQEAKVFFINVQAAESLVENPDSPESVPDPGENVLALYRTCPHLGCQIPQLCEASHWFECLCHGSKYTVLGEKRDGPAPRGMDRFNVIIRDGVYVIDTSEKVDGPPIGTATFDTRVPTDMAHCAG
jgi:cytochrome b6-f complex iron-sulfur subunit